MILPAVIKTQKNQINKYVLKIFLINLLKNKVTSMEVKINKRAYSEVTEMRKNQQQRQGAKTSNVVFWK